MQFGVVEQMPFKVPPGTKTITEMAPTKSNDRILPITEEALPYFLRQFDLIARQKALTEAGGGVYYDNMLMLFTWPILEQFTPEKVKDLISYYRVHKKPMIELANGWYHIEILGGETLQDGDYEPTFEFVIQPATNEEATINADMNFSFEITSSAY